MSEKNQRAKIMIFGTFDGLHRGHLNFFQQAKNLAKKTFLIVSIARDKNVFRIKGEAPKLNERKRALLVKKNKLIDKVVLAGATNHIPHILRERPDVIALGYDQRAYVKNLRKDLKNKGFSCKIVRLQPYKEKIYKNKLLREKKTR